MPQADPRVINVSELNRRIKDTLEPRFSGLWVSGEISGYRGPHASGHIYCTLKDAQSRIPLVLWRSTAQRLKFSLEEGMEVNVFGNVEVYPPRGSYQLIAGRIEPKGVGELQLAFRQLCRRLEAEGLFDDARKRPLPSHPGTIGVVTATTGAAIQDMLRILHRRDPRLNVVIYPARVQGQGAAEEIEAGIRYLNRQATSLGLEALIIGRGGGSLEDLWAFNEEIVARAVFSSDLPVISAVGHEIDWTVADMVADLRAATPSEAAELVVPELESLVAQVDALAQELAQSLGSMVGNRSRQLESLAMRMESFSPRRRLRDEAQRLDDYHDRIQRAVGHRIDFAGQRLEHYSRQLEGLSPLRVLGRGYSVARQPDGQIVDSIGKVVKDDRLIVRVADGEITTAVISTKGTAK